MSRHMKLSITLTFAISLAAFAESPDFTREVRPILSRYCFKCHGPDEKTRKGELRLDIREEALKDAESGAHAVVPGKPDESELVKRIFHDDPEEAMPPRSSKQVLSPTQKDILKRWIAAGAEYREHWSFIAPKKTALPGSWRWMLKLKLKRYGTVRPFGSKNSTASVGFSPGLTAP